MTSQQRQELERKKFLKTNPTFQQNNPSTTEKIKYGIADVLGQGANNMNYLAGTIGKYGSNLPADVISMVSPKVANTIGDYSAGLLAPTSKEEWSKYNSKSQLNRADIAAEAVGNVLAGEVIGAGITKASPYIKKGISRVSEKVGEVLPNAYKLNPFAFKKPIPGNWNRQVGKAAIDDALTTGKVYSSPTQKDMIERIGEGHWDEAYNRSINGTNKFNLEKAPEAAFFQKDKFFFPMERKPTGKGYKGTAHSDAEYLITGKLPDEALNPQYMAKYYPSFEQSTGIGGLKPAYNDLSNFNLYKRHWLQGYKKIVK